MWVSKICRIIQLAPKFKQIKIKGKTYQKKPVQILLFVINRHQQTNYYGLRDLEVTDCKWKLILKPAYLVFLKMLHWYCNKPQKRL
jgi:hypothetical protein